MIASRQARGVNDTGRLLCDHRLCAATNPSPLNHAAKETTAVGATLPSGARSYASEPRPEIASMDGEPIYHNGASVVSKVVPGGTPDLAVYLAHLEASDDAEHLSRQCCPSLVMPRCSYFLTLLLTPSLSLSFSSVQRLSSLPVDTIDC